MAKNSYATCIVIHAGYIESLDHADTEEAYESVEDFYLHARDDAYMCGGIEHGMIIAGHTPTIKYEEFPYNNGDVYRMYDESLDCIFYDVDCECVMRSVQENAKLVCIRLENEKIYYVRISDQVKSKELYLDGMMGLVTGDALGVLVEFSSRKKMQKHPVLDLIGYGTYPVSAGSWSDDSSMALASLSAMHSDGINLKKTMDNFVAWEEKGKFTPAGEVFDEGSTCSFAIYNYKQLVRINYS